jgi:ATP-dependent Lhr-like helicase
MHPRLLELVRQHRSTILFVNARRLAERLATALNDLAGEELARAHHGSIAREERQLIEEALKAARSRRSSPPRRSSSGSTWAPSTS